MASPNTLRISLPDDPAVSKALAPLLAANGDCRPTQPGEQPDIVIVRNRQALSEALAAHPGAFVVLAADSLDAAEMLACLRLGASEALTLGDLAREFPSLAARRRARTEPARSVAGPIRSGKLHAFIGSKGGVGVTTLAVNFARELTRQGGKDASVALVDMNLPYGETPLFLGMALPQGLSAALRDPAGPTRESLLPFIQRHASGLSVLALPSQMDEGPADLSSDRLCGLVDTLRSLFDHVVVDLGIYLDELTLKVMEKSDGVFLVAVQNMACVRNIRRFLDYVRANSPAASKVSLLINRHLKDCDLLAEDMEKALGLDCRWRVPNDYEATLEAINQGTPLVDTAPKSPVSRAVALMAQDILGLRRSGGLSGLGRLFLGSSGKR